MKYFIMIIVALALTTGLVESPTYPSNPFGTEIAGARVHVRGYQKSNGTYVQSHYRSSPNNVKWDNYSY